MAFQERDLSKAALFLNTGFLDRWALKFPRVVTYSPFLTIVLTVTLYIAGNIAGVLSDTAANFREL